MAKPLPPLEKLEAFLEIIETQRARHLERNPEISADAIFNATDMREIHKRWMEDGRWMSIDTALEYDELCQSNRKGDRQKAHQKRRQAFSAFLFQVIGNKHVLLTAIQYPVFSVAQPEAILGSAEQPATMLHRFMKAWDKEKTTKEYRQRVEISAARTEEQTRKKNAAHEARCDLRQGEALHAAIERRDRTWEDLSGVERTLVQDFNSGRLQRAVNARDAAFGWNRAASLAAGSTASRLTVG